MTHSDTSPSTIVLGQMKLNLTLLNISFCCGVTKDLCFIHTDFPALNHVFIQIMRNMQDYAIPNILDMLVISAAQGSELSPRMRRITRHRLLFFFWYTGDM